MGSSTVASGPRIEQAQPFHEGYHPHVALAGRLTLAGYHDLDQLNDRSDRMFNSDGMVRHPNQALQLTSTPSTRGEVDDGSDDKYRWDVFATAPADNRDHVRFDRRIPVKRRGLLHRLKSNGTAGINSAVVP